MNKLLAVPLIAAATLAATQAVAGPRYRDHDGDRYGAYRGDRTEYADVVAVDPIYRNVRIEQPRRECWDERVVREERRGGYGNNGVGGALVGAIAGGVAGHQFGNGRGKDAATVLGAILGAGVGQRVALDNQRGRETVEHVSYEEVCKTVVDHRVEQRVEAYDVTYRYGGRTYHTTLPYDPGQRIAVDVNVRPVSY